MVGLAGAVAMRAALDELSYAAARHAPDRRVAPLRLPAPDTAHSEPHGAAASVCRLSAHAGAF